MNDLIAGQLQISYLTYTSTSGLLAQRPPARPGRHHGQRSPVLPDLPAISETVPGYDSAVWYAALAPAGHAARHSSRA